MRNVRKIVISCFQTEKKTCEIFSDGRFKYVPECKKINKCVKIKF